MATELPAASIWTICSQFSTGCRARCTSPIRLPVEHCECSAGRFSLGPLPRISQVFDCVFLDMDGVLVNFMDGAHRAHGRTYVESEYPAGLWEIADHWAITPDEFWAKIHADPDFWHQLTPYAWCDEVLDLARTVAKQVKIATSPAKSPYCFSGKRIWWERFIPRDVELIICKSKHLLAAPGRLLIDDADHNVDAWRNANGSAVLFPQRWNTAIHNNPSAINSPLEFVRKEAWGILASFEL